MYLLQLVILLWTVQSHFGDDFSPRQDLLFPELVRYDGYSAEEYFVTTIDGYILRIFRIPPNKNCTTNKGTLLFAHGLFLSSDDCIVLGPGRSHCYIYSDNCYDVWVCVLNVRGNVYSRNHTYYDPDKDLEYWQFSFDDIAIYDLSAVIDHILNATGREQLSYVAHSQGATILLILCAKRPEYNAKIIIGIGLSTTAWLYHATFLVLRLQSAVASLLTAFSGVLSGEIFPRGGVSQKGAELLCGSTNLTYPLCSYSIFTLFGYDGYQITSDALPVIVGHTPAGTSLKNFNRWGSVARDGFREYDYGPLKNIDVYGQTKPPEYTLGNVNMKWVMISAPIDNVGTVQDIKYLVTKLPNASLCVISTNEFTHLDYVYGKDINKYIIPIVFSAIESGTYTCT